MERRRLKSLEDELEAAVAAAVPLPPEVGIRIEEPQDREAVRALMEDSFDTTAEADLVDALRGRGEIVLSLVAEIDGEIVGYAAFPRISVESEDGRAPAVALAPLAVAASHRNSGIASRLIRDAHACLAATGESLSVVLGEPAFYGKFGYGRHRASGFASDYPEDYVLAISFADAPWYGNLVYPAPFRDI